MRKLSLVIFALILTALLACRRWRCSKHTCRRTGRQVALTLERRPCFGTCPIYTVTIYSDGTVVYKGTRFVDVTGEQTGSIDPETVEQLIAGFEAAGYFDWNDATPRCTSPTCRRSPPRSPAMARPSRSCATPGTTAPRSPCRIWRTWIDIAANTSQWTGADVSPTNVMGMNSPDDHAGAAAVLRHVPGLRR